MGGMWKSLELWDRKISNSVSRTSILSMCVCTCVCRSSKEGDHEIGGRDLSYRKLGDREDNGLL